MAAAALQLLLAVAAKVIMTVWTKTLASDGSGDENSSIRNKALSISAGGTEVRVTFKAVSSGTSSVDNASVGVFSGSNYDTVAPPVELLFSGVSGFSILNGAEITSDWATLTTSTGNTLIITEDIAATNGNTAFNNGGGDGASIYTASNTYANATPGAGSVSGTRTFGVSKIEVR